MNGIAYNPGSGQLWVTGKMWPNIYQIQCEL
ncbi:MAG: glutaminyl-peptide cyclotransferase [Saprospiraceae bacterium]|nr:glutaminyl-peptide cyclotransferase [Saprospiraceae bacterium]MBK9689849.1 glutaminyl-peptide cyclotransferase [Saprospiraceae bacterium]